MCLKDALKKLTPMISENKRTKIASVVASRSNSLSILIENIQNKGNENAILRSMDAFGCLNLHKLITSSTSSAHHYKNDKPRQHDSGACSWVKINHWFDTQECVHNLRSLGYTLAVTSPTAETSITDIDFSQKLVVGFGNEIDGITEELDDLSDIKFSLPMCGFVQSFNISVSVSITLYHAYLHRVQMHPTGGDLTKREQLEWIFRYYMHTLNATPLEFKGHLTRHEELNDIFNNCT